MKSEIVVVGANSQLGKALKKIRPNWVYLDRHDLDLTNLKSIAWAFETQPAVIINFAAFTAVDDAEKSRAEAELLNAAAVGELAKCCGTLIQISTDYVFSGDKKAPYLETDSTGPLNYYGQSKLLGEKAAFQNNKNSVVIRTSWVYSAFNKNFVKRMIELAATRDQLKVVDDQIGTPTNASDLVAMVAHIAEAPAQFRGEVFHYSNMGQCSWYELTKEILHLTKSKTPLTPIKTSEYPLPAVRPHYSVLDKTKISKVSGLSIPTWQASLEKFIQEYLVSLK